LVACAGSPGCAKALTGPVSPMRGSITGGLVGGGMLRDCWIGGVGRSGIAKSSAGLRSSVSGFVRVNVW
jgi:hypothetical protein